MDYNAFQLQWESAEAMEENEQQFITPDDGDYAVIFEGVTMENKTNADKTQVYPSVIWTFIINSGNNAGKRFRKFSDLKSKNAMGFFKMELNKLLPAIPKQLNQIVPGMSTILRKVLNVTVKTYGDTQPGQKPRKSVYVNGFSEGETPNYNNNFEASTVFKGQQQRSDPKRANVIYDDDVPF